MNSLQCQGWAHPIHGPAADHTAGDIVVWKTNSGPRHGGAASDRRTGTGTPLVIHSSGSGAQQQGVLFEHNVIDRYRPRSMQELRKLRPEKEKLLLGIVIREQSFRKRRARHLHEQLPAWL